MSGVRVHEEVEAALAEGRGVVALETAVLTHGLPREPPPASIRAAIDGWGANEPVHLGAARAMQRAVRSAGGVPATIGVLRGELRIGLDDDDLADLARDESAAKAAARDLGAVMAAGGSAGATVSATLEACALARRPIRALATGGIGGVHRHWADRPDISADLFTLARCPVCVVCSGPKSMLDLNATAEALDSLGVPIVGWKSDTLAQFIGGVSAIPVTHRIDSAAEMSRLCQARWSVLQQKGAIIVSNPASPSIALSAEEIEQATAQAETQAEAAGIRGGGRTPFVLSALARLTGGRSLAANLSLLVSNAALAGTLAAAMAAGPPHPDSSLRDSA
jgi:pseudouridine-5'-phosphate glycosidase